MKYSKLILFLVFYGLAIGCAKKQEQEQKPVIDTVSRQGFFYFTNDTLQFEACQTTGKVVLKSDEPLRSRLEEAYRNLNPRSEQGVAPLYLAFKGRVVQQMEGSEQLYQLVAIDTIRKVISSDCEGKGEAFVKEDSLARISLMPYLKKYSPQTITIEKSEDSSFISVVLYIPAAPEEGALKTYQNRLTIEQYYIIHMFALTAFIDKNRQQFLEKPEQDFNEIEWLFQAQGGRSFLGKIKIDVPTARQLMKAYGVGQKVPVNVREKDSLQVYRYALPALTGSRKVERFTEFVRPYKLENMGELAPGDIIE